MGSFYMEGKPKLTAKVRRVVWFSDFSYEDFHPFKLQHDTNKGAFYLLDAAITCTNNDLYYSNIDVCMKFASCSQEVKAILLGMKYYFYKIKTADSQIEERREEWDIEENIKYRSLLSKDQVHQLKIPILVEHKEFDLEYIKLVFWNGPKEKRFRKSTVLIITENDFSGATVQK